MQPRLVVLAIGAAWAATVRGQTAPVPPPRNLQEFDRMFRDLSNWGRWGTDDQLGTINRMTEIGRRASSVYLPRRSTKKRRLWSSLGVRSSTGARCARCARSNERMVAARGGPPGEAQRVLPEGKNIAQARAFRRGGFRL